MQTVQADSPIRFSTSDSPSYLHEGHGKSTGLPHSMLALNVSGILDDTWQSLAESLVYWRMFFRVSWGRYFLWVGGGQVKFP